MISEKNLIMDGQLTLWGGVDSGVDPSIIEIDKCAFAVNCRMRGGILTHRPAFKKLQLDFNGDAIVETRFSQRFFQVAGIYQPDEGSEYIIASIGGRQFRVDLAGGNSVDEITITATVISTADFTVPAVNALETISVSNATLLREGATVTLGGFNYVVDEIPDGASAVLRNVNGPESEVIPAGTPLFYFDVNPALNPRAWIVQAEKYWILQNGQNLPYIWDGSTSRRALSNITVAEGKEIPIGNVMEYAFGRLAVALPDQRSFAIGDLVGSSSGTLANNFRDAVLKFTQNTYLGSGRNFAVPQTAGGITAMRAIPSLDAALGQGPLQVFTPSIAFTVQLPSDATTWAALVNPVQTVSLITNGSVSQDATILVNGDIWYRAVDGWRSLVLARRDFNTWANTPVSSEMDRVLDFDDQTLLENSSAAFFDGRMLMTVSPARSPFGNYHRGLIALDMNRVSGLREKLPPSYDGFWNGLNVLQVISGRIDNLERCFAFSVNYEGRVELFELLPEGEFDDLGTGEKIRITWSFESRVFGRGDTSRKAAGGGVFDLKRLENAELWLDEVSGKVDIKSWWRPVGSVCWFPWRDDVQVCSDVSSCTDLPTGECQTPQELKLQYKPRIQFGKPPDTCEHGSGRPANIGEGFQVRVEFTGHCRMRGLRVMMRPVDEPSKGASC